MFKPLLAVEADLDAIRFPVLASPKIDGIRCLITLDGAVSRNMKPIPNKHIRAALAHLPYGYDGELLTYTDGQRDDFNVVQSKVMRRDGTPDFKFMVFDNFAAPGGFQDRLNLHVNANGEQHVAVVWHVMIKGREFLEAYESDCVERNGWEGIMLRDPGGIYKHGRSTVKEGILLKVKRFSDDEAEIIGTIERMHNTNEATTNALGRTERSSAKAGLVGMDTLGALSCRWNGIEFEIGTGMNDQQRAELWLRRSSIVGKKVTFKYQGVGTHGAPRFPVFRGIRHDI